MSRGKVAQQSRLRIYYLTGPRLCPHPKSRSLPKPQIPSNFTHATAHSPVRFYSPHRTHPKMSLLNIFSISVLILLTCYLLGCFHYTITRTLEPSKTMDGHESEIIRRDLAFRKGFVEFIIGEYVQVRCGVCGKRHV